MTVLELKDKLAQMPDDAIIQLLDSVKNANEDSLAEGSSAGCYTIEDVTMLDQSDVPDGTMPWVAIHFTDPDYPYDELPEAETIEGQ